MRTELNDRGVETDGMNGTEMKTKLDQLLCGIRRPIALMCEDGFSVDDKLIDYAIAQLEPLHDLKTTICKSIIKL